MKLKKMKNTVIKGTALLLVLAMLASLAACGKNESSNETASSTDTQDELTKAAMGLLTPGGHSDSNGKEETVYVLADASGNQNKVLVSTWLKNGSGSEELADVSSLTDIENTKGDESYTENGNGSITWASGGSDIYYQGTGTAELPLDVHISYQLDGKTVTPEELNGVSGHLTITFSYTNKSARSALINGEKTTLYSPCAVVSGLILDNTTGSDITVTNGKVINDGDRSIIVGLAMPGMRESLIPDSKDNPDLETLKQLLPDSVTIEANVTDFSPVTTLTAVSWDLLQDFTDEGIQEAADNASEDADELQDGVNQLKSGAGELADYLAELSDGTDQLAQGANTLSNGTESASSGSQQLAAGMAQLQSQVAALPSGTARLLAGAQALDKALKSDSSVTGSMSVYEALQEIQAGALQIQAAADAMQSGAASISAGAQSIAAGAVSGDSSAPGIYEAALMVKSGLQQAGDGLSTQLQTAAGGMQQAYGYADTAEQLLNSMDRSSMTEEQSGILSQAVSCLEGSKAASSAVLQGMGNVSLDLSQAESALDGIMSGAQAIAGGAQVIASGARSNSAENPGLYEAAASVSAGAAELANAAGQLSDAVSIMTNDDNLGALIDGLQQLSGSGSALVAGVSQLTDGADSLSQGLSTLSEGAKTLASGASSANEATVQLTDGANALSDGVKQLDEEGISRIVSLLKDDVGGITQRIEALKECSLAGRSYGGCAAGIDCSTVYIYKTAAFGE